MLSGCLGIAVIGSLACPPPFPLDRLFHASISVTIHITQNLCKLSKSWGNFSDACERMAAGLRPFAKAQICP